MNPLYIILIILTFLSAFFSAAETAFASVSLHRLRSLAASGDKRAIRAVSIAENFDRALSAILIGNNVVNITAASIGTLIFTEKFGNKGVGIATVVMTVIVLIFGEVLPKSFAKESPESFALLISGILCFKIKLLAPAIFIFVVIKNLVGKLIKTGDKPSVTEAELKLIIDEIEGEGVLNDKETHLVKSAIDFNDILVEDILTPRVDVVAIDINASSEVITELFISTRFSRIPVFSNNIDNIIGILCEKDFFHALLQNKPVNIADIMRKPFFIPRKKKIGELMHELQKLKSHFAVVIDQYGGALGIVTFEDILEELVGDIWDEDDDIIENIETLTENQWLVTGETNISDFLDEINYKDYPKGTNGKTIRSWALEVFGKIPIVGESFTFNDLTFTIEEVEDQRILKIRIIQNIND